MERSSPTNVPSPSFPKKLPETVFFFAILLLSVTMGGEKVHAAEAHI